MYLEAKLFAHVLHLFIFKQGIGNQAAELLVPGYIDQPLGQLTAEPLILPFIGDHDGKLSSPRSVDFAHTSNAKNLVAAFAETPLSDQSDLAIVVIEADA